MGCPVVGLQVYLTKNFMSGKGDDSPAHRRGLLSWWAQIVSAVCRLRSLRVFVIAFASFDVAFRVIRGSEESRLLDGPLARINALAYE